MSFEKIAVSVICLCMLYAKPTFGAGQFSFEPPFEVKHSYGENLLITKITLETTDQGETVYLYVTSGGREGFLNKGDVLNHEALLDLMYPERVENRKKKAYEEARIAANRVDPSSNSNFSNYVILDPDDAVALLKQFYGHVCRPRVKQLSGKTLVIDWTSQTKIPDSVQVLAEINNMKTALYQGGIQYFQFPNNAGTYNVIDFETGVEKTITDRAQFYFD